MRNLNNIKSYFVENNLSYDKMLGAFLSTAAEAVMVNNCIQNNTKMLSFGKVKTISGQRNMDEHQQNIPGSMYAHFGEVLQLNNDK